MWTSSYTAWLFSGYQLPETVCFARRVYVQSYYLGRGLPEALPMENSS